MPDASFLAVLSLGFVLGLKHATDADHIVAVTTFVGEERKLSRACAIGLFWGLGHTLALSAVGFVVIGLRISISQWLAERLELGVAVMLVLLGARAMATAHRRWHRQHHDIRWSSLGLRPLLVGVVHGTAGSAALALLVLSTIPSPMRAVLYILIFGFGSMIGMLAISVALSLSLGAARDRFANAFRPIQAGAGALSCLFGIYLGIRIWNSLS